MNNSKLLEGTKTTVQDVSKAQIILRKLSAPADITERDVPLEGVFEGGSLHPSELEMDYQDGYVSVACMCSNR